MEVRHVIVFDSVTKTYRGMTAPALDHVSFHVKPGSICGVVGLSGAGKSTLIRCMTGLERVDSGSIRIGSIDITALSGAELRKAQRNLGVVFSTSTCCNSEPPCRTSCSRCSWLA